MKKILLLLIPLASGAFVWIFWASRPICTQNCQTAGFIVQKGEGASSIAQRLENEKLIRSSTVFQMIVVARGLGRKIQAGNFDLNPAMTPFEVAESLTHGRFDLKITIPEGWRREEVGQKISQELAKSGNKNFNYQEFITLTSSLEGQLFPDTYYLSYETDAQKVVDALSKNYKKKTESLNVSHKDLILASLVEREARHDVDRPIIAGIIIKRLENGWPLQIDAAVQYAVGTKNCNLSGGRVKPDCQWWPKNLTKNDLSIESPYNTYRSNQIPPAPIANPGLAAIKAVLTPKATGYWYYISDNEGQMHYAQDLEGHQQNIRKYLLN